MRENMRCFSFPVFAAPIFKYLFFLFLVLGWRGALEPAAAQEPVTPDPDKSYQSIEGWGSSLCWWAHMVGQWEDEEKIDEVVDLITSPDKLNMNVFRYNIGGGDDPSHYSTEGNPGHMAEGKGVRAEMEGFKPTEDSEYDWTADAGQRKILLKIKERRPDAIFEAFSNSAPYWMTYSGCSAGNDPASEDNLKPEYYGQFSDYLIEVCRHYRDEYGLEFRTLEPFNEPLTDYWGYLGGQEGCHFDVSSQVDMIRVLYDSIQSSDLNIAIAAADESNLWQTINGLETFIEEGDIIEKLGQFNTHTYGGDNAQRQTVHNLVKQTGLPFWQSETGPIGIGGDSDLQNNLNLTQRMFDDLYQMKPDAWLDWQLFEEHNNTWCQIRGSFEDESFQVIKNFYVRMQVTRFVKQGYTIIESGHPNVLSAMSPDRSELVVVFLNASQKDKSFDLDLSSFYETGESASLYRTSNSENCRELSPVSVSDDTLNYQAPALSLSTMTLPVKAYDYSLLSITNGFFLSQPLGSGLVLPEMI